MKAVGYAKPLPVTAAESLVDFEAPVPELRPRDLLVRVGAVAVNPVDVKQRAGAAPAEGVTRILGFDAVGVVEAVGPEARLFKPGDAVFYAGAIDRPGSNAELQAVDERIVGRKPASLSVAEAAALPLTAITAWELLFDRLKVPYGVKTGGGALLVVNGAGGVGSILTQLARRLTGLTVIATASRPESIDWCRQMGAHHVIDHHRPLDEEIARIGIPEVQYVAGLTGTERHLPAIVRALAPQGALALIDDPATLDIAPLKRKSLSVHWELMFTRPLFGTPDMIRQHELLNEVADLVDAGLLRTTLRRNLGTINAANLREAHALLESGRSIGKVVLEGF
ncbi:zinc-binding alcohol dehydrogenase family protein [Starkeya koreensis]|uniref:Zinc-type alcohol dehydrogenase-like protein n=1 Tax=Ancylobacter koreensis TaxID=266121 RepID=A0ABT0DIW0_9HYPH|nr:zinc-binding alcohol dehydrogenase family protein [Ancylobacter koreensis]MCK0207109.1 zinc-binding alcohol dehydrogenase family protein [Ancylobacter koreensis]